MEIKPCPFCGSPAEVTTRNSNMISNKPYRVECLNRWYKCPVNLRTHHMETEEEAVEAWNKRT